jgi:ribonuclease BN (tRNA processing enzyme)
VGRLVLTHIPAWHDPDQVLDEAAPHYSGETLLAAPGAAYRV